VQVHWRKSLSESMVAENNLAPNFAHLILIARYLTLDFGKILDCVICLSCNFRLLMHFDPDGAVAEY
jgi:hypothetical protein